MAFKQYNPQSSPFANRRPTGADAIMGGMQDLAGSLVDLKDRKDAEDTKKAKETYDKVQADRQAKDDLYQDYLRQFQVASTERQAAAMQPTLPGSNAPMPGETGPPTEAEQLARPTPGQFQNITTPSGETMQLPPLQSGTELAAQAEQQRLRTRDQALETRGLEKKQDQLYETPKAPTTKNIGGREMGWNPATGKFDQDFGPAGSPDKPPVAGGGVDFYVGRLLDGSMSLKDVPVGMQKLVADQLQKQGGNVATRQLPDTRLKELTTSNDLINRMASIDLLPSSAWQAIMTKVPDIVTEITGLGEAAKIYEPTYFMFTATMLKAIQGSRPSDFDMKVFLQNMPKLTDPPDVKAAKVASLKAQLIQAQKSAIDVYRSQGYNVTGFNTQSTTPASQGGGFVIEKVE